MSIASRISSMQEHLQDDYGVLDIAGADLTNVDKNIVNLKPTWKERLLYFMNNGTDEVWENWDKVTGEGEEISLNNTLEAKMKIDLKGNTYQDSTTGKNKLNVPNPLSVTGYNERQLVIPAGDYIISAKSITSTASSFTSLILMYNESTLISQSYIGGTQPLTKNITLSTATTRVLIYAGSSYNESLNVTTTFNELMVRPSNTTADYEPYTGGMAIPNPDYPQDVHVVSGDNTIIVSGNNLFDEEYYRNATYTINTYKNTKLNIAKRGTLYFKAQLKTGKSEIGSFYLCLSNRQNPNTMPNNTAWAIYGTIVADGSTIQRNYATFNENDDLYFTFYPTSVSVDTIFDTYNFLISSDNITYVPFQGLKDYQVNLGVENLWKNQLSGFIPVTGSYPTTNSTYPNSRYIAVKLLKGHSLTLSGSTDNYGRCRYIDIDTNQSVGTITSSVVNDYYTSTGDFSNGFVEGTITAKKDFIVGIMDLRSTANSLVVNYGGKQTISDNPIELCKIGDYQDRFIRNSGKNLFDESILPTNTMNGIKWEYTNNKIKISGTATSTYSQSGNTSINLQKGTYYFVKSGTTSLTYNAWFYNIDGTLIANSKLNNPFTINETATRIVLFVGGLTNGTSYNQEMNFMVSTTSGEYEPYGNGKWYLNKQIGKVVLDGSESWYAQDRELTNSWRYFTSNILPSSVENVALCDNFISVNANSINITDAEAICRINEKQIAIRLNKSRATSIETLKTWLGSHNTKLYYVLTTPTTTEITNTTLISQLDALAKSYNSQTNISQENNDLASILNATALEEME